MLFPLALAPRLAPEPKVRPQDQVFRSFSPDCRQLVESMAARLRHLRGLSMVRAAGPGGAFHITHTSQFRFMGPPFHCWTSLPPLDERGAAATMFHTRNVFIRKAHFQILRCFVAKMSYVTISCFV